MTEAVIEEPGVPGELVVDEDVHTDPEDTESNLVKHARYELTLLGEEPETIEGYLRVIQAFADMGHSGGSAAFAIPVLSRLLQYGNLRPLTNDPDEWVCHKDPVAGSPGLWQNTRCSEAFSTDGGKTYQLLSETEKKKKILHRTRSPETEGIIKSV
jgi:hypothetical protein